MKKLSTCFLLLLFTSSVFPWTWGNGGRSKSGRSPIFGTHDWIGYEGFRLANKDHKLDWLDQNINAFFIGTEAPDFAGAAKFIPGAGKGYGDSIYCHCILFDANGTVTNDRLVLRVQQEFDKAKAHFDKPHPTKRDYKLAAFYLGAMAHYLGDLSQFMHLMGKKSHWGSENQTVHHRYEEVIDASIDFRAKTSGILEGYIKPKTVSGDTAGEVAIAVARFTETGGGSSETTGKMYKQLLDYLDEGIAADSTKWDKVFLDQTGENVNTAANGVAKLMKHFEMN